MPDHDKEGPQDTLTIEEARARALEIASKLRELDEQLRELVDRCPRPPESLYREMVEERVPHSPESAIWNLAGMAKEEEFLPLLAECLEEAANATQEHFDRTWSERHGSDKENPAN